MSLAVEPKLCIHHSMHEWRNPSHHLPLRGSQQEELESLGELVLNSDLDLESPPQPANWPKDLDSLVRTD